MPLNRYQLRNEFSLADPELYKIADKDDPEALLEGVAMAGLVGVLRQLGDLAEFAAEIFHDLHEEVMATAARGHGLIIRTQQLEAEFPSIERKLLSQTSHAAFLYNSGVEWHPNLRMDQSVVTPGDLPRFVMDSYEECRGPPRLFLLDKFDVAGAGACLKRFTDPSFFKSESTSSTGRNVEVQREKKTRRVKKRGPRLRNGDTPESFPSSHAKLHQLFLEERIESGINDPSRRVKLKKRQFTGSLFEQDNVRSYMEKFLDSSPQEQKILHEICIDPLPLTWKSDNPSESGLEIVDIGTISPVEEPEVGQILAKPSRNDDVYQDKNLTSYGESRDLPGLDHENHDESMAIIPVALNSEEIVERESVADVSDRNSDGVASEIDNYMDALANIESEFETDSESKRNATTHLNLKSIVVDSDGSERQRELRSFSLDSHSVGNSVLSEDGDNFSKERETSSCSDSFTSISKNTPVLESGARPIPANTTSQSSNPDSENLYFDHYSTEEIVRKEREKHVAARLVHDEVNDLQSEEMLGKATNTTSQSYVNKKVTWSDIENGVEEKLVEVQESDSKSDNSDKFDVILGESNQENSSEHKSPIVENEDRDSSSNFNSDLSYFLETNSHNNLASTLVEGNEKNWGTEELVAYSDTESSIHPDKKKSADVACDDFFIPSTQESSKDLFCVSDSSANLGTNPFLLSSLDFATENLPCSWQDPSKEDTSDYGNLTGSSNQLQNSTYEFSSFDNIEVTKINESDSSETDIVVIPSSRDEFNSEISLSVDEKFTTDDFTVEKSSSPLDSLETQHELLNSDTILDVPQNEDCEQISENDIDTKDIDTESQSSYVLNEAGINHTPSDYHSNQNNMFSQDGLSPLNILSERDNNSEPLMEAENNSDQYHNVGNFVNLETIDDLGPVDIKNDDNHENASTLLTSVSNLEEFSENPVLVSEDFHQNKEDLTNEHIEELTERRQTGPIEENLNQHEVGTTSLVFHGNGILNDDNQVNLEENSEKNSLSQQDFPNLGKRQTEPRVSLEPPSLPPLPPMQWRLGRFQNTNSPLVERQQMLMTLPNMHPSYSPIPSISPLGIHHHPLSSFQPVPFQTGNNNTLSGIPQPNLPTSLPAVHYTFAPLQPVTLPTQDNGTETISQTFTSEGLFGYSDGYLTQQGVFALPMSMPIGVSDGFYQINTSSVGGQENRVLTVPLTSSALNGYVTQQRMIPLSMPTMVSEPPFVPNTSGIGRQENVSSNGTVISQESQNPKLDHSELSPLMEGDFSESNGSAIQNEVVERSSEMLEEESRNLNGPPTVDQPPPGLVAPDSGRTWLSAYDGVPNPEDGNANETLPKKPPRPRNPLIDEVVAIDKSKLRKVERSKPQPQSKPEEGESILEQMQLRKVERVKPQAESKVEGGENLLEHLQLRKVGDRMKPSIEQKSEERDFLVEQLQLRKVGERVKPPNEPKSEEKEFLLEQLQLRKVKAKAKEEVEPKVEEIESPMAQLRKVRERVRDEVELRIEDSDSPRLHLRKVTDRVNPLVPQKAEERDSLFEQIRNKSFNLKPAVAARPNIQGPRTNLKVAAILEKASTIRQAMAGSDEDDDADSWSDES